MPAPLAQRALLRVVLVLVLSRPWAGLPAVRGQLPAQPATPRSRHRGPTPQPKPTTGTLAAAGNACPGFGAAPAWLERSKEYSGSLTPLEPTLEGLPPQTAAAGAFAASMCGALLEEDDDFTDVELLEMYKAEVVGHEAITEREVRGRAWAAGCFFNREALLPQREGPGIDPGSDWVLRARADKTKTRF